MTTSAETHASVTTTRQHDDQELPVPGTYDIDGSHTHVGFAVRHLMVSKVRGGFGNVAGTVFIGDDPSDSAVEVSIEMASVATGDVQRDAHLRSPDFFDVERFPTMTYRSRAVRHAGGGRFVVDGELSIRGVTRPVALDVRFDGGIADPWGNIRAGFSARAEIDRSDFGLTWNQALEGGGVVVGRTVTIELEAEAVRRS